MLQNNNKKSFDGRDFLVIEASNREFKVFKKKEKRQYIADLKRTSYNCGY